MRIAISLALLVLCATTLPVQGEEGCAWDPHFVSADSKPLHVETVKRLAPNLHLKEIIAILGPAKREVGLGTYVLQWDMVNGQVFSVTVSGACAVPMARGLAKVN
jgi:hypothetical protein